MKDYVVGFFREVYDFINPEYSNIRRARFEELKKSGELEWMCASEVHRLFGIRGESSEI